MTFTELVQKITALFPPDWHTSVSVEHDRYSSHLGIVGGQVSMTWRCYVALYVDNALVTNNSVTAPTAAELWAKVEHELWPWAQGVEGQPTDADLSDTAAVDA